MFLFWVFGLLFFVAYVFFSFFFVLFFWQLNWFCWAWKFTQPTLKAFAHQVGILQVFLIPHPLKIITYGNLAPWVQCVLLFCLLQKFAVWGKMERFAPLKYLHDCCHSLPASFLWHCGCLSYEIILCRLASSLLVCIFG